MTLEEIEALPKNMLTPKDVAGYLGCSPYSINLEVRENRNPFPFPVVVLGKYVKIPKIPFLKVMRGEAIYIPKIEIIRDEIIFHPKPL